MIPFFRKIRKKLATENKFIAYSRYAIGEIVLVVIGILIALQINNWNQERIQFKETKVLLNGLRFDVEEDIKSLKNQQNLLGLRREWADYILKSLDSQKVTDSSRFILSMSRVGFIFNYSQTFPTYTEIVSSGKLSYIKSETLKNALAKYQSQVDNNRQIESSYNLGLKETERLAVGHLNGMPMATSLVEEATSFPGVSFNLKTIAEDTEFYKSIKHISYQTSSNIDYINNLLITRAERLNGLITDELENY